MNTIQHDSLMMRIQKMMTEIEDAGSSRELTPLEVLMAEMLHEGNKTHAKALRAVEDTGKSINHAISAAVYWRRIARTLAFAVVVLWAVAVYLMTR